MQILQGLTILSSSVSYFNTMLVGESLFSEAHLQYLRQSGKWFLPIIPQDVVKAYINFYFTRWQQQLNRQWETKTSKKQRQTDGQTDKQTDKIYKQHINCANKASSFTCLIRLAFAIRNVRYSGSLFSKSTISNKPNPNPNPNPSTVAHICTVDFRNSKPSE